MAVRSDGRPATTHYRVLERYRAHSYLSVRLTTGRTHQIRLHLAHLKYPIVGDPVYGGRFGRPRGASEELAQSLRAFGHQALHAARLAFDHPRSGKRVTVETPVPADFAGLLEVLRSDAREALRQSAASPAGRSRRV
jgi:23S rRNA pseudouridine1911/1915/1917 synthase